MVQNEQRVLAILAHILGLLTGFLGPLVLYLVAKPEDLFAREHAKEALNFQITLVIGFIISGVLVVVLIGILGLIILGLMDLIFSIMGAVAASNEQEYRYPVNIRFIS